MKNLLYIILFFSVTAKAQPWKGYAQDYRHYHYIWADTLKQSYNLAYDATTWNGSLGIPTMDAVRDKIESLSTGWYATLDAQYADANNSGTTETDLYSKTIAANTLTANGQSIGFEIGGDIINDPTATINMKLYFAGSSVGATNAITATGGSWTARGTIIRSATGGVRIMGEFIIASSTSKVFPFATYVSSSIDYTTTNIFKITGTAGGSGGASNQITARYWKLIYQP